MGAEDYLLVSSILGVLAQRLVRVICPSCREPEAVQQEVLREAGLSESPPPTVYHGAGCQECGQTGFRGRLGIFELMLMDQDVRRLTVSNADASRLRGAAIENGMRTLRLDGFDKVRRGLTSMGEVLRSTHEG